MYCLILATALNSIQVTIQYGFTQGNVWLLFCIFFSIEVPVSYLNKVISKTGMVHICFWKDWAVSILTWQEWIWLKVMTVFSAHRVPDLHLWGCRESSWIRFPQLGFLLTFNLHTFHHKVRSQVSKVPSPCAVPTMSTLGETSPCHFTAKNLFVEIIFGKITSREVAYFLQWKLHQK